MSVVCGNRAHQGVREYIAMLDELPVGRVQVHHDTVAQVRQCLATDGGIWTVEDQGFADEANAERRAEEGYERWLEDGGPHREAIAAEDEIERRMEAMDLGLQAMRAEREMHAMEAEADRAESVRDSAAKAAKWTREGF